MRAVFSLSRYTLTYFNQLKNWRQLPRTVHVFYRTRIFNSFIFNYFSRRYLNVSCIFNKDAIETDKEKSKKLGTDKPEKKKKEKLTYITLVQTDNNVTVTTLEDATKLALRRNLKLIKIKDYDRKSDRSTYQLMTTAQYLAEDKTGKINSSVKGTKLVSISSKINEHDIIAKIKMMIKWLEKRNEVRIVITDVNGEAENVFNKIAEGIKEIGKVVQKRVKGVDLKFQVVPLKKQSKEIDTSSDESTAENR